MVKLGKVYGNLMVDVMVTNAKLADRARRIVCEVTGVSYERADELLKLTDNQVKVAIVVEVLGITADEARRKLEAHDGVLRTVISPPK